MEAGVEVGVAVSVGVTVAGMGVGEGAGVGDSRVTILAALFSGVSVAVLFANGLL